MLLLEPQQDALLYYQRICCSKLCMIEPALRKRKVYPMRINGIASFVQRTPSSFPLLHARPLPLLVHLSSCGDVGLCRGGVTLGHSASS